METIKTKDFKPTDNIKRINIVLYEYDKKIINEKEAILKIFKITSGILLKIASKKIRDEK